MTIFPTAYIGAAAILNVSSLLLLKVFPAY
jgi:hypothetical protein